MKVISFDPGGDTGWVTYTDGTFRKRGELGGLHHSKLRKLLSDELLNLDKYESGPVFVICERFDNRDSNEGDFAKLISCEYIGVIKEFCQTNNVYLIMQGSDVKKFNDDKKLEATGWFIEYKLRHARDAARHLLNWLINGNHMYDEYRMAILQKFKVKFGDEY